MASTSKVPIQWKTEDDLLLKNSLESGASLEALARGAVQFSRRFTLQELRDRWLSLLYNPNVAEQAAIDMFELEYYGANHHSRSSRAENNCNERKDTNKRKLASVRRRYYSMRKKFRNEFFSSSDLAFFKPNPQEFSGRGTDDFGKQVTVGDNLQDHLGLREEDLDILRHAFPDTVSDIALASSGAANAGCSSPFKDNGETVNVVGSGLAEGGKRIMEVTENPDMSSNPFNSHNPDDFASYEPITYASDHSPLRRWRKDGSVNPEPVGMIMEDTAQVDTDVITNHVEGKENSLTGVFADPDSLLNLSNDDEILVVNVVEKDSGTKISGEDSIRGDQQIDVPKIDVETVNVSDAGGIPALSEEAMYVHDGQQLNIQPAVDDVPSKPSSNYNSYEYSDGKICCTLNTDNTEIPCNDDIFLLIHPSSSFSPFSSQPHKSVSAGTSFHENDIESHDLGIPSMEALYPPHFVGHGTKIEMLDAKSQALNTGFVNKSIADSSKGRLLYSNSKLSLMEEEMKVGEGLTPVTGIQSIEASSSRLPESVLGSSSSDKEESLVDDDVPYFSDVEAMILEMDLDACNQDFNINKLVPSFQYAETKRAIIRLEQCARSCLQRAMTSKGALAILYGRHLKYYISKPEVLLGRSTDDIEVDIDLRKEGRANKISRRQAIIKIEPDGSFFLKNLGKSLLYVNGVGVATGQMMNLSSSCLIEIKGMSFVFEINQRNVREQFGKT